MIQALLIPFAFAQSFVEEDAVILWEARGTGQFGWALSELADIDGDGVMEVISSAPYATGNSGEVVVLSGASGEELHRFSGSFGAQLGFAIADAGDVDGDGTTDIIAGAPNSGAGQARVWSGADGTLLFTLTGENAGDAAGFAVSSGGDMDGDGHSEVVVGAPNWSSNTGRVYVFSGEDGSLMHTLEAEAAGDRMGSAVSPAGDVNGDGVPDVLVGARDAGASRGGLAYVFSGADGSMLLGPLGGDPGDVDLGYFFVGHVGDVDGDSVGDLYVGDFSASTLGQNTGQAFVFSGADGATLHTFVGEAAGEGLGCGRGARDMDGDGVPDLAIGSWSDDGQAQDAGRVQVFSGADGSVLRVFTNTAGGENFGFDAIGVGDVNGDGAGDLVASAATADWVVMLAGTPPEVPEGDDTGIDPPDEKTGCATGPGGAWAALGALLMLGCRRRWEA
ncbi:MAG: FG-GAP repeat protein [Alphaproteobacteria bacterium]|nr:FG-GAP repeat protein [Alphaproteobacteria bacterium]